MSCEEDDDWYDEEDLEPIIETRKINISVTTITKSELSNIEEAMILCMDRKLEKLNLLLKQMNVYCMCDCLIVNDRYSTSLNFIEIVRNFGMNINQITVNGFKGKTYVISDIITKLLNVSGATYDFSKLIDVKTIPNNISIDRSIIYNDSKLDSTYDVELANLLREIKRSGKIKIEGSETFIDGISQGIISDEAIISEKLKKYLINIKTQACQNNKNVQYGTAEILYARARQMGYAVKKEVKGKEIQLVLERLG